MSESSTTQLQRCVDRLQAGEERARDELLACTCARLTRLARKMFKDFPRLKRFEQTDDVIQSALLRLCRALREVTPPSVQAYLRLAALHIRRELIDLARHYYGPEGLGANQASIQPQNNSQGSGPPPWEPPASTDDPSELALWQEFHEQVEALPEAEREVFDLLWYQELSQADAAALLGVSERTIKRRWQAARLKLHETLHGHWPGS